MALAVWGEIRVRQRDWGIDLDNEPLKLLIADDNNSDRLILKTILEKQGHEVICTANGAGDYGRSER